MDDTSDLATAIQAAVRIKQESTGNLKSYQKGEIRDSSVVVLVDAICKTVGKYDTRFQKEREVIVDIIKAIDLIAADGKFDRQDIGTTVSSIGKIISYCKPNYSSTVKKMELVALTMDKESYKLEKDGISISKLAEAVTAVIVEIDPTQRNKAMAVESLAKSIEGIIRAPTDESAANIISAVGGVIAVAYPDSKFEVQRIVAIANVFRENIS